MTKAEIIESLGLTKHPEGGYFRQTYVSRDNTEGRPLYSSILFLLSPGDVSHLHVLQEDELWYYQEGKATSIYEVTPEGKLIVTKLGPNTKHGEVLQYLVRKGNIFGSRMDLKTGYSVVGCLVAPAFTYDHFHLVSEKELPAMAAQDLDRIRPLLIAKE